MTTPGTPPQVRLRRVLHHSAAPQHFRLSRFPTIVSVYQRLNPQTSTWEPLALTPAAAPSRQPNPKPNPQAQQ